MIDEEEPNRYRIDEMLKDFDVDTEEELQTKLLKDSETLPCQFCKKEVSIFEIHFINSEPCCNSCYYDL